MILSAPAPILDSTEQCPGWVERRRRPRFRGVSAGFAVSGFDQGGMPGRKMRCRDRLALSEEDSEDTSAVDRAFTGWLEERSPGFSATQRGKGRQVPIRHAEEFGAGMP